MLKFILLTRVSINYLRADLKGHYQKHNIKTVIQTIEVLKNKGFKISEEELKKDLLNVVKNTGLKGRWQILQEQPKIICDTAHNKEGLIYSYDATWIRKHMRSLHIVFGVVNDKDLDSIIPLLPKKASYYFCKPNVPRGLDAEIIRKSFFRIWISW